MNKLDNKYRDSFSSYHITATFLAPCFSKFHFCTENLERLDFIDVAASSIINLINIIDSDDKSGQSVPYNNKKKQKEVLTSGIFDLMEEGREDTLMPVSINSRTGTLEETIYSEIELYKGLNLKFKPNDNTLIWWFGQRKKLPLLPSVARNIFVIPGSSSEIERRFSRFNSLDIVTKKRNKMTPQTISDLMMFYEYTNKKKKYLNN